VLEFVLEPNQPRDALLTARSSKNTGKQILKRPVVIHLNPAQPGTGTIARGQDRGNTAAFLEQINFCAGGKIDRPATGTALNSRECYLLSEASAGVQRMVGSISLHAGKTKIE
jgi:hypothetical protein